MNRIIVYTGLILVAVIALSTGVAAADKIKIEGNDGGEYSIVSTEKVQGDCYGCSLGNDKINGGIVKGKIGSGRDGYRTDGGYIVYLEDRGDADVSVGDDGELRTASNPYEVQSLEKPAKPSFSTDDINLSGYGGTDYYYVMATGGLSVSSSTRDVNVDGRAAMYYLKKHHANFSVQGKGYVFADKPASFEANIRKHKRPWGTIEVSSDEPREVTVLNEDSGDTVATKTADSSGVRFKAYFEDKNLGYPLNPENYWKGETLNLKIRGDRIQDREVKVAPVETKQVKIAPPSKKETTVTIESRDDGETAGIKVDGDRYTKQIRNGEAEFTFDLRYDTTVKPIRGSYHTSSKSVSPGGSVSFTRKPTRGYLKVWGTAGRKVSISVDGRRIATGVVPHKFTIPMSYRESGEDVEIDGAKIQSKNVYVSKRSREKTRVKDSVSKITVEGTPGTDVTINPRGLSKRESDILSDGSATTNWVLGTDRTFDVYGDSYRKQSKHLDPAEDVTFSPQYRDGFIAVSGPEGAKVTVENVGNGASWTHVLDDGRHRFGVGIDGYRSMFEIRGSRVVTRETELTAGRDGSVSLERKEAEVRVRGPPGERFTVTNIGTDNSVTDTIDSDGVLSFPMMVSGSVSEFEASGQSYVDGVERVGDGDTATFEVRDTSHVDVELNRVSSTEPGEVRVEGRVKNEVDSGYGETEKHDLTFSVDGERLDSRRVSVKPDGSTGFTFATTKRKSSVDVSVSTEDDTEKASLDLQPAVIEFRGDEGEEVGVELPDGERKTTNLGDNGRARIEVSAQTGDTVTGINNYYHDKNREVTGESEVTDQPEVTDKSVVFRTLDPHGEVRVHGKAGLQVWLENQDTGYTTDEKYLGGVKTPSGFGEERADGVSEFDIPVQSLKSKSTILVKGAETKGEVKTLEHNQTVDYYLKRPSGTVLIHGNGGYGVMAGVENLDSKVSMEDREIPSDGTLTYNVPVRYFRMEDTVKVEGGVLPDREVEVGDGDTARRNLTEPEATVKVTGEKKREITIGNLDRPDLDTIRLTKPAGRAVEARIETRNYREGDTIEITGGHLHRREYTVEYGDTTEVELLGGRSVAYQTKRKIEVVNSLDRSLDTVEWSGYLTAGDKVTLLKKLERNHKLNGSQDERVESLIDIYSSRVGDRELRSFRRSVRRTDGLDGKLDLIGASQSAEPHEKIRVIDNVLKRQNNEIEITESQYESSFTPYTDEQDENLRNLRDSISNNIDGGVDGFLPTVRKQHTSWVTGDHNVRVVDIINGRSQVTRGDEIDVTAVFENNGPRPQSVTANITGLPDSAEVTPKETDVTVPDSGRWRVNFRVNFVEPIEERKIHYLQVNGAVEPVTLQPARTAVATRNVKDEDEPETIRKQPSIFKDGDLEDSEYREDDGIPPVVYNDTSNSYEDAARGNVVGFSEMVSDSGNMVVESGRNGTRLGVMWSNVPGNDVYLLEGNYTAAGTGYQPGDHLRVNATTSSGKPIDAATNYTLPLKSEMNRFRIRLSENESRTVANKNELYLNISSDEPHDTILFHNISLVVSSETMRFVEPDIQTTASSIKGRRVDHSRGEVTVVGRLYNHGNSSGEKSVTLSRRSQDSTIFQPVDSKKAFVNPHSSKKVKFHRYIYDSKTVEYKIEGLNPVSVQVK